MDESPQCSQSMEIPEPMGLLRKAILEMFLGGMSIAKIAHNYHVTAFEVTEFLVGRTDARVFQRNVIPTKAKVARAKRARKVA